MLALSISQRTPNATHVQRLDAPSRDRFHRNNRMQSAIRPLTIRLHAIPRPHNPIGRDLVSSYLPAASRSDFAAAVHRSFAGTSHAGSSRTLPSAPTHAISVDPITIARPSMRDASPSPGETTRAS